MERSNDASDVDGLEGEEADRTLPTAMRPTGADATCEMKENRRESLRDRDSRTDAILGGFFLVLGLAVACGVLFAGLVIDRLINGAAGFLLVVIGVGFLWRGRVLRGRS